MQAWLGKVFSPFNRQSRSATISETAAASPLASRDDHQSAGNTYLANGQLDAAEQCYRQAIAVDPEFAKAFCKLGFVLKEQGRQVDANATLRRAAVLDPSIADVWFMLSDLTLANARESDAIAQLSHAISIDPDFEIAYSSLIQLLLRMRTNDQAQAVAMRALQAFPQSAEFHFLLGNFRYEVKDFEGSEIHFKTSIIAQPGNAYAYANLALTLQMQNSDADALIAIGHALAQQPDNAEWRMNRGVILSKLNRLDEAIATFQEVIALSHDYGDAFSNLGSLYQKESKFDLAESNYRTALAHNPDSTELLLNLGAALQGQRKFSEARKYYLDALERDPMYLKAYVNLSSVCRAQKNIPEAMQCLLAVLKVDPDYADAHLNKALLHLSLGEFAEGWQEYEYRWQTSQFHKLETGRPLWLGDESLSGRTILLHAEQGIGDTIQFVRYVELVKNLGAKILLSVPQVLVELFRSIDGIARISPNEATADFDFQCPLMSLPLAFKTTLDSIPAKTPYLFAPTERTHHWATALSAHHRPRVGLVWAGNPKFLSDFNRSAPLRLLLPLQSVKTASFFCLQKEIPARDNNALAEFADMHDMSKHLTDYSETAAIIANLDLVITVDTSVAHLAGALGKPVWVLLPFESDFRWLRDRLDSPWYPSARLFRQAFYGDWAGVAQDLVKCLEQFHQ